MTDKPIISHNDRAFLALIQRSPDIGEGWRAVSKTLWPLVLAFKHQQLIELGDQIVRLSADGEVIARYRYD